MSPVPILAITMASMIGISISGVWWLRSDCRPLTRRNIPDDNTMSHSKIAANHCVFPKPYVYRLLRDFSEILIVAWLTPDTNISRNESSADPRSARLHEKSPMTSLIAAIIPEIMSAKRIHDCGDEWNMVFFIRYIDKRDRCILLYYRHKYLLDERVQIRLYPHQVPSCCRWYSRVFQQKMDDRLHRDG